MDKGDRVIVNLGPSNRLYRKYRIDGAIGVIERVYSHSPYTRGGITYGVRIEHKSADNGTGLFWLKDNHLDKILEEIEKLEQQLYKETDDMAINLNNVVEGYKICEAYFNNNGDIYFGIYYEDIKDTPALAVVQLNGRRELATIVRTNVPQEEFERSPGTLTFEVVGIVDDSAYNERKDKLKKRAEIKEKMKERAAKFQEEQFWKMIASEDAEMAELLKEYNKYGK